jgi:transcriptional regulator with XRE-family HTH domain
MPFRGDRLKLSREKKQLSQREFAELCGFTAFQVSRYENERNEPGAISLETMAQKLEVSADYLLGLSHEPQGEYNPNSLSEEEQQIVDEFRRKGWKGIIRLGAERLED